MKATRTMPSVMIGELLKVNSVQTFEHESNGCCSRSHVCELTSSVDLALIRIFTIDHLLLVVDSRTSSSTLRYVFLILVML